MSLAMLFGISTATVIGAAIKYRFSLLTGLGTFYGALALCQFAYLGLVISHGRDTASSRKVGPGFREG